MTPCNPKLFLLAPIAKSEPNKTSKIKIITIAPKIKSSIFLTFYNYLKTYDQF